MIQQDAEAKPDQLIGCSRLAQMGVGLPDEMEMEDRRRKTTRYCAFMAGILTDGYCGLDVYMDNDLGVVINGAASLFYLLCASYLQRPCGYGVRHLLLGSGWVHLLCLCLFVLGPDPGAHFYMMGTAITAALLFQDAHWSWKWFYLFLSLFGLTVIELELAPLPEIRMAGQPEMPVIRLSSIVLTTTLMFMVLRRYLGVLEKARLGLKIEHKRSEELLLNILPGSIATRLKRGESVADAFDDVTVLFADIASFTAMAAGTPARQLVEMLNDIFSAFDEMAERHGLEKIKTIGDAYMVAGGIPDKCDNHTEAVASMAVEMVDWVESYCERTGFNLGLRVGMHAGPVVAGVIGSKKFIYDLWGDTVNLASRMESQGAPNKIQVTDAVRTRLSSVFDLEERGLVSVKGRGEIVTHWLKAFQEPGHQKAG